MPKAKKSSLSSGLPSTVPSRSPSTASSSAPSKTPSSVSGVRAVKKREGDRRKSDSTTTNPKAVLQEDLRIALERVSGLESEIASVLQEVQRKVQQLECITEFAGVLNSTLDPELVREKALEATCQMLGCQSAGLLLVDSATGELFWQDGLGILAEESERAVRIPIDDRSVAGKVAMSGEPMILNSGQSSASGAQVQTLICVPLKAKDQVIGVLQAVNKLSTLGQPEHGSGRGSHAGFYDQDLKMLRALGHQVAIAVENSRLYTDLKKSFYQTVEALAEAIEKKDHYTGGHTKRVVHYSVCIAKYLDVSPEQLERIKLGAILHDVGKIGIEDKILKKASALDKEEWKVMQTHPEQGFDIMSRVEGLRDVVAGMRYHHERWDGKGYPLGLKGEEIPMIARIIALADTYDAMVSTRPYRKGMPALAAYDEIVKQSGTQFDPIVVEAFQEAFRHEKMGRGSGGFSSGSSNLGKLSNCD